MTVETRVPAPADVGVPTPVERAKSVLPVVREHANDIDDAATFPAESLQALRGSGLMGLLVPIEYGGLGGTLHDLAEVAGVLGGSCVSTAMIWAMHCQQVAAVVRYGSSGLRAELLPQIARGEVYLASVTTERGKGGHLLSAEDALDRRDGKLYIDRDAPIVTGGEFADGFLITMRDLPDAPPEAVSLVYAPRSALQTTSTGDWNPMGMRGTNSRAMRITGSVDPGNIVGDPGGFHTVTATVFAPVGHLAWAACWLGAARGALSGVLKLIRSPAGRGQFNRDSELLRSRIARVRMELDAMAALLAQGVRDCESDDIQAIPVQLRLNALKVYTAERSFQVVHTLVELVGLRHGYLRDTPLGLERAFRDLRSASLNFANDRLLLTNGSLALLDQEVHLAYQ